MTVSFIFLLTLLPSSGSLCNVSILYDNERQRPVPIDISLPLQPKQCAIRKKCNVAIISPGSGFEPSDYRFVARALNAAGYLTVGVQSVLQNDPPEGTSGNIIADRTPGWQRGVDNLLFVKRGLSTIYPQYNWNGITLIGHSNGGDLSALAVAQNPTFAKTLVTLDSRRYPLPTTTLTRLLSIRGSDFPADPGVLPKEIDTPQSCIVTLENSKHNDMNDKGPVWLKSAIVALITSFLEKHKCGT